MNVHDYAQLDATAMAQLLRAGEVSAREAQELAGGLLASVGHELGALVQGPWSEPLAYDAGGTFAGVPFVYKDLMCHAAGVPARSGSRLAGDGLVFRRDTELMRRFRRAGLATLGVTSTSEIGLSATTEPTGAPATRNPWDPSRSAGGSSGGTAALVAAGVVPVGHGNDGAGSIRVPAAWSGLVGLKPGRGRIPVGPDIQESMYGFTAEFVLTRTLRDAATFLDELAGWCPGEKFPFAAPERPWREELRAPDRPLRIGVQLGSWNPGSVDAEVRAVIEQVARVLEGHGHDVESVSLDLPWESFVDAMCTIWGSGTATAVAAMEVASQRRRGPETLEHTSLALAEQGQRTTVVELAAAMRTVNGVARRVGSWWERWDVLVTPTASHVAPLLGANDPNDPRYGARDWTARQLELLGHAVVFNVSGTPALSVPVGESQADLPIGVQLAADMNAEATLLRVGAQLEQAMPWAGRRPQVHVTTHDAARPVA